MKNRLFLNIFAGLVMATMLIEPVMAGPGGRIASAIFTTFWGKVLLGVLLVVCLPLIVYILVREKIAERRAQNDLRFMSRYSPVFEWMKLQQRAKDCFYRVHASWENTDLSEAAPWMTSWYWQNQQLAHLERWRRENLVNVCKVKKIVAIKPLLFVHRNDGAEHEASMVAISITANMADYLQHQHTHKVVEGTDRYQDVETIWVFTLEDGQWKVTDIEDSSMSLAYARMGRGLPEIGSTIVREFRAS